VNLISFLWTINRTNKASVKIKNLSLRSEEDFLIVDKPTIGDITNSLEIVCT